MPINLLARPTAGASSIEREANEGGDEQTDRSSLLAPRRGEQRPVTASLSGSPLRRVYLLTLSLLLLVGLLLCASLLASSSSASSSSLFFASQRAVQPAVRSQSFSAYSPLLQPTSQRRQPLSTPEAAASQAAATAATTAPAPIAAIAADTPHATPTAAATAAAAATATSATAAPASTATGDSRSEAASRGSGVSATQTAAPTPPLTSVSNAAGVRHVLERRYGGYIARENYNLYSNHALTLAAKPAHDGCKLTSTQAGAQTYTCDIFNLTEAVAVCSSLPECVGLVCWKEHWEGCQLKGRPLRHDNNHRFVALYKSEAAVEEAEAAWRQQAEEARQKDRKGQLGTHSTQPCGAAGSKCVVSMGLYGADERYTGNVLVNARLLPRVLPGWLLRVYHDSSVPSEVLSSLREEGAELLDMSGSALQGAIAGMYWRFLVSEDESVDRWLIRDADCRVSAREAAAVSAWLASGYSVHILRDHPNHGRRMMGGLWGGVKHSVRNMSGLIAAAASDVERYNGDQEFLAQHIYPLVEFDQLSHDSWTCLSHTNSHPFPSAARRGADNDSFVGMIHGKDSDTQLNGDIRCCLVGRENSIACRERLEDRWG